MKTNPPVVAILGGGYAALAAAAAFSRHPSACRIKLIAPRKAHIKITRLHETLRYPLHKICVPYVDLGKRLGFEFIQAKLKVDGDSLRRWQNDKAIVLDGAALRFDYLLIATGTVPVLPPNVGAVLTVADFCLNRAQTQIQALCAKPGKAIALSVVGAGATGVQFAFALADYLKRHARRPWVLRLVNYEAEMLAQFPAAFHHYAQRRLGEAGIIHLPRTAFVRQDEADIVLRSRDGGDEYRLPSDLTLLCLGVKPSPMALETNAYGQIQLDGNTLDRLFAAGDCAHFDGPGANTPSAQVALRKGQTAADNILAKRLGKPMQAYDYREQGYLISLGQHDAIGWIDQPDNIITGITAATVKAAVEKRYDWLLAGVDTDPHRD